MEFHGRASPDFKAGFVDELPASNADIGATMAQLLGLDLPSDGFLKGRVLAEALRAATNQASPQVTVKTIESKPTPKGLKTLLREQVLGNETYLDSAGFSGRTVGLDEK